MSFRVSTVMCRFNLALAACCAFLGFLTCIKLHAASLISLVSFAAVFWMSRNAPPQRNGCSQPNHIPLPLLANHSFGFIFKNQFAPNSSFETYRAQSENVLYLCIPSSETSQINMRLFRPLFKDAEKYTRLLNELCL